MHHSENLLSPTSQQELILYSEWLSTLKTSAAQRIKRVFIFSGRFCITNFFYVSWRNKRCPLHIRTETSTVEKVIHPVFHAQLYQQSAFVLPYLLLVLVQYLCQP